MKQEEFDEQFQRFMEQHASPMMDRAADDEIDGQVAIFGLLEMASMILRYNDEDTALSEFEDYVARFLNDWRSGAP